MNSLCPQHHCLTVSSTWNMSAPHCLCCDSVMTLHTYRHSTWETGWHSTLPKMGKCVWDEAGRGWGEGQERTPVAWEPFLARFGFEGTKHWSYDNVCVTVSPQNNKCDLFPSICKHYLCSRWFLKISTLVFYLIITNYQEKTQTSNELPHCNWFSSSVHLLIGFD